MHVINYTLGRNQQNAILHTECVIMCNICNIRQRGVKNNVATFSHISVPKVLFFFSILRYFYVSCTDGKISVIVLPLIFTVVPSNICMFLYCRPFVVNTTFSTGLVGIEVTSVSWLGQLTVGWDDSGK